MGSRLTPATIRYVVQVRYGISTDIPVGHTVAAEISENGNAWWMNGNRRYLVYPGEYEVVGADKSTLIPTHSNSEGRADG